MSSNIFDPPRPDYSLNGINTDIQSKLKQLGYDRFLSKDENKGLAKKGLEYSKSSISIFLEYYFKTQEKIWNEQLENHRGKNNGYIATGPNSQAKHNILEPFYDTTNLKKRSDFLSKGDNEIISLIKDIHEVRNQTFNSVNGIDENKEPSTAITLMARAYNAFSSSRSEERNGSEKKSGVTQKFSENRTGSRSNVYRFQEILKERIIRPVLTIFKNQSPETPPHKSPSSNPPPANKYNPVKGKDKIRKVEGSEANRSEGYGHRDIIPSNKPGKPLTARSVSNMRTVEDSQSSLPRRSPSIPTGPRTGHGGSGRYPLPRTGSARSSGSGGFERSALPRAGSGGYARSVGSGGSARSSGSPGPGRY